MTVPRSSRRRHGQRGVTLVEQIMVLAISAVLAGIAAPPLRNLMNRNALQVAQTDFIAALQHAREAAVISGKRTLFCPSRDGGSCSDDMRWDNGWLLGHDTDADDQPDHGPLYTGPGYGGKLIVRSSAGRHVVRFRPDGSASGSNITLVFCRPHDPAHALSVFVSNSGRIRGAPADAEQAAACAQGT
ncbi:GspH/FimT family pseudopilin [Rhodanobacter umsongensis]|uniref:Type II secretion system protein H n=1 Tax=Rhodanobacter umsongensis TaxID=633153 RepID=A0ABW0JPP0_9GAMM